MKSFEEALDDAIKANFEQEEPKEKKRASLMMEGILDTVKAVAKNPVKSYNKLDSWAQNLNNAAQQGGALGAMGVGGPNLGEGERTADEEWEKQVDDRWNKLTSGQKAYYNNPDKHQSFRLTSRQGERDAKARMKEGQPIEQAIIDQLDGKDRFRAEAWNQKVKRGTSWARGPRGVPDPNGDLGEWSDFVQRRWTPANKTKYNDDFDAFEQAMRDWAENQPYTT